VLFVVLLVIAVLLGGIGLVIKGLLWLFLIAVILFVVGAFMGVRALRNSAP
jgi:hypothetical protein